MLSSASQTKLALKKTVPDKKTRKVLVFDEGRDVLTTKRGHEGSVLSKRSNIVREMSKRNSAKSTSNRLRLWQRKQKSNEFQQKQKVVKEVFNYVQKFDVIAEIAGGLNGIKFGPLFRRDADGARAQLK